MFIYPYIDSEIVHRAYQIGGIGFLSIVICIWMLVRRCLLSTDLKIALISVIAISVLTTYFFTNMLLLLSLSVFLAYNYSSAKNHEK